MKKMHLKRKYLKRRKINNTIVIIILLIISIIFIVFEVGNKAKDIIIKIGKVEAKKIASIIINKSVSSELTSQLSLDQLFKIEKNENGEVETIDFDSVLVNKVLAISTIAVEKNFRYLEAGEIDKIDLDEFDLINYDEKMLRKGYCYKVPLGIIFGNPFLSNLGPKIPIKFTMIGNMSSNINSEISNYGINNALIESYIRFKITLNIIIPFYYEPIVLEIDVPIAIKIINGKVPDYYSKGYNESSPIFKVPVE